MRKVEVVFLAPCFRSRRDRIFIETNTPQDTCDPGRGRMFFCRLGFYKHLTPQASFFASDTLRVLRYCRNASQSGDEFVKPCKPFVFGKSFDVSSVDLLTDYGNLECAKDVVEKHVGNGASQSCRVHFDEIGAADIFH